MKTMLRLWRGAVFLAVGCFLAGCSHPQAQIWDVSAVMGQPIDAARHKLGTPQHEELPPAMTSIPPVMPSPTAQSSWKSDDTTLSASWKTGNKRITSWTILREDADAVRDEDKAVLLKAAHLQEGDPRYSVDWLEAPDRPLFYSGARITPTAKTHAVTLRVIGGSAMIEVSYQIAGSLNQSETLMTIAPWEISVNLLDDAQLTLKARVLRLGVGSSDMKVEIVSDGTVKASDASTGRSVQCQFEL